MKKSALFYIVMAGILWGTSGLFFHWLEPFGFSPIQMTAMRGVVAAVVLFLYVLLADRRRFRVSRKELMLFVGSGLSLFGTAACYFAAIQASSVSTAVILMYTAPVFVMGFSVAFLGEKLNRRKVVAVGLMIVGCALVSGIIGGMKFSFWGIVLGLGAGVSYSAYNIFTKIEMLHHAHSLSATLYSFLVMAAVALCVADPADMVARTMQAPTAILPLMFGIGLCTSVLPYLFYTRALQDVPAGTASALSIIEPMAATVFSVAFLGEKLEVAAVCGMVLILAAVLILHQSEGKGQQGGA